MLTMWETGYGVYKDSVLSLELFCKPKTVLKLAVNFNKCRYLVVVYKPEFLEAKILFTYSENQVPTCSNQSVFMSTYQDTEYLYHPRKLPMLFCSHYPPPQKRSLI